MNKLPIKDYKKVLPIFETLNNSQAVVFSVLEGNSPGEIFVDDISNPKAALMYVNDAFFFVAGDEKIDHFSQEIPSILFDVLIPKLEEKEMVLFPGSQAWKEKLTDVLDAYEIITIHRKFFRFNPGLYAAHTGWKKEVPEGFHILEIDKRRSEQEPSLMRVLEAGSKRFGVCIMHGDKIVGYCTSVFVGHGEAEIDIFTDDEYRGRGLARLTACAFIDECLSRGLVPGWACWPEREASRALAIKLGFEELPEAPALLWVGEDNQE